jgi:hypothetical protein
MFFNIENNKKNYSNMQSIALDIFEWRVWENIEEAQSLELNFIKEQNIKLN